VEGQGNAHDAGHCQHRRSPPAYLIAAEAHCRSQPSACGIVMAATAMRMVAGYLPGKAFSRGLQREFRAAV
jgi:hypothetical protein